MLQHPTYLLLDAARMGAQIEEAKTRNKTHDSLYRGGSEESLAGVAPYIFRYAHLAPFSTWFLKIGWGESWGILLKSSWPISELHKHFRKFLLVKTEDGQELYFRFYDPRVLRIFLPTCDALQIREFFGSAIDYFIVEDQDADYCLRFSHENGVLQTERFSVKEVLAALPEPEPLPQPTEDPLPPETIAALKEQGIDASTIIPSPATEQNEPDAPEPIDQPTEKTTPPAAPLPTAPTAEKIPAPATYSASNPAAPSPKPNTKWNMFD